MLARDETGKATRVAIATGVGERASNLTARDEVACMNCRPSVWKVGATDDGNPRS